MAKRQLDTILRFLRHLGEARTQAELTDGQLLRRFVSGQDEAAFGVLVQRHGGLVLGVCRRVLHQEQDAEDAFQATFLVLARKAASIRNQGSLACWLHGVAHRIALNARKSTLRRQKHETRAERRLSESPAAVAEGNDLHALLDEELRRLPERYRAPFVLCCLEGMSKREAADHLGWKEGTVSSRLARARALLQRRLTRRGITPTALTGAAPSEGEPPAAVPAVLAQSTVQAAALFATGQTGLPVSAGVVALAEGVLKTMLLNRLGLATLMLVLATLIVCYGVLAGGRPDDKSEGEKSPEGAKEPAKEARPKDKKDTNRVRMTLTPNKDRYEVGEPIVLIIRLTNTGPIPLAVPSSSEVTGRHEGYSFEVRNDRDEMIKDPANEYITLMHSLGSSTDLPPGESSTRELLLNYRVPPLGPGKYTVQGRFQPRGEGQSQAESPRETFRIVETPAAKVEERVARLVKELKDGGDAQRIAPLLGFTGSPKALGPLLDLLHAEADGVQVRAAEALLYLDRAGIRRALLDSLKRRGPSSRLVHLLVVPLEAKPDEVIPLLLPWLEDRDGQARDSAVYGLWLANRAKAPELFAPLKARLGDSLPRVRTRAAAAIGVYQDAEALKALKGAVRDPDPGVSEQATIAVGWVATGAKPESALRKEAIDVLREVARTGGRAGEQATYWLGKVEGK
jgi:RNA polymerase sigma factor (sigma-70 family)